MTDVPLHCDGITNERERLAHGSKLSCCPLCGSIQDDGYALCFHCSECGYFQCCDCDGYYDKGAMTNTPTPVPEDLQELYVLMEDNLSMRVYNDATTIRTLIERIAQVEARNKALLEALEGCLRIFGDSPEEQDSYAAQCVTSEDAKFIRTARAAIAARKE